MLLVPPDVFARGGDLRAQLAGRLKASQARQAKEGKVVNKIIRDAPHKNTLQWTDPGTGISTSLLVTTVEEARAQLGITAYLRKYYAEHDEYREVVRRVIQMLRQGDVLNKHGKKATVGTDMKTVSAAFWCAGLRKLNRGLATEDEVLRAMAIFDASAQVFKIRLQNTAIDPIAKLTSDVASSAA